MYSEILILFYFAVLYAVRILNIELGVYRDYLLDSYSIIIYPGLKVEEAIRFFTGKYIGLAIGIAVNLTVYFLIGAFIGILIWLIKRYRTDEDF